MTEALDQAQSETKSKQDIYRELLEVAKKMWPDRVIRRKRTGLSRTTEWRIENGSFRFHAKTIERLVKAINNE